MFVPERSRSTSTVLLRGVGFDGVSHNKNSQSISNENGKFGKTEEAKGKDEQKTVKRKEK